MTKFNLFLIIVVVFLVSGAVFYRFNLNNEKVDMTTSTKSNIANTIGYLEFSPENQTSAKFKGKSLLFFAATTWCQTCSELDKEILKRINEAPSDLTILKVDYDNDKEMKKQYNITVQHTLVLLDEDGVELDRWVGGGLDNILERIQKS
jgi:hypothetical protein